MCLWHTTVDENGLTDLRVGNRCGQSCATSIRGGDCLKVGSNSEREIPLIRLTRVGKGTIFCRTWKQEGRIAVSVTDLWRSNRLPMEALCKPWWNVVVG